MGSKEDKEGLSNNHSINTEGGAYVKRTIHTSGGDFIGRDKIINIHNYPPIMRAPLREVFDQLIEDRTALFGGREAALVRIAEFIQTSKGGYLVITAPAGFGKTALMANLVAHTPEAFAYHFFTPIYGDGLTEDFFLRNVVEQLAQWHGHTELLPARLSELRALYHQFLDEPLDQTQVLVLDGLDEVTTWSLAPYLSRRLPDNLHFILTVRDTGQDWTREYSLPAEQTQYLSLGGLTRDEVAGVLQAAGEDAGIFATDPTLLDEVMRVSAYPADEGLGADPFYVRLLAEDAAEGHLTPTNIVDQPQGLDAYLGSWWREIKQLAGDQPTKDLFGTLTVALGPLSRADLEAINPSLVDDWAEDFFDEALHRVRRWVIGDAERGYALAHPRLHYYLRIRINTDPYLDRLLAYCADWQTHHSPYVLAHYAQHLTEVEQIDDLFKLVESEAWTRAKYVDTPWVTSLVQDLQLAFDAAGGEDVESWARSMGYQLRRAIIEKHMSLMSYNSILFLAKLGDVDRALDFARHQGWRQFELTREIARIVAPTEPDKAVDILVKLAHSADNRSVLHQCTYRLAVAQEILQITPQSKDTALRMINQAKTLEDEIPEPKLIDYRIEWKLPVLALSGDLDTAIQFTHDLPELQRAQALRLISLRLPPGHPAKQSLAEQALLILEALEQTPEVLNEKMKGIVTLLPFIEGDEREKCLNSLVAIGNELQSIGEPDHYKWSQFWTIKKVAEVNLDWAKTMLLQSDWMGKYDAWSEVVGEIAKNDYKEAVHLLTERFGNYAGHSQVLADIIKIVAVERGDLKEGKNLIEEHRARFRNDLSEAYLALAEGYLAQGDRQKAWQIFREYVFVIDDQVIARTRDGMQLAILRRAGVFLSVEEAFDRLMDFHSDLREEKEEAELILAIIAARQGKIDFLKEYYFRQKGQTTIVYELAKNVSPEAAREYAESRIDQWSNEGRATYAQIAIVEAQQDPTKLEIFLEHFNPDNTHHFCVYMTALPHALEDLVWANSIEPTQAKRVIEDIYPQLVNWQCPYGDEPPKSELVGGQCSCYGRRDKALAHLIGILAKVNLNRAEQMANSLPDEPIKVAALKQILLHTQADKKLINKIIKATQEVFDASWQQAASLYDLATLLPATMADQINDLIRLAEPLPGDKPPHQTELKLRKGKALMTLVDGVDQFDNIRKSLDAIEDLALLDTRGVGKLRVFDLLINRAIKWSKRDKLALLHYLWKLAPTRELLDVQAFIAFSILLINSLVGKKGFWRLYRQIEWAYQELPQFDKG